MACKQITIYAISEIGENIIQMVEILYIYLNLFLYIYIAQLESGKTKNRFK